jgi:hypothetical protein
MTDHDRDRAIEFILINQAVILTSLSTLIQGASRTSGVAWAKELLAQAEKTNELLEQFGDD